MTPTAEILRTRLVTPPTVHRGADGWVHQGIGWWRRRQFTRPDFAATALRLSAAHAALAKMPDAELQSLLDRHRHPMPRGRERAPST